MSKFFDKFPQITYDIQGRRFSNLQGVTNIFFRVQVLRKVLGNISAYYEHTISDEDTPEILADKIYNSPEAHWVILLANDIIDPLNDWPMNTRDFNKYIIKKYGSIETAKTTYHHYEKVIQREETRSGVIVESRYVINPNTYTYGSLILSEVQGTFYPGNTVYFQGNTFVANVQSWNSNTSEMLISNEERLANTQLKFGTLYAETGNGVIAAINTPEVPFDYYYGMTETQALSTHNLVDGKTVVEIVYRDRITNYDWEVEENEKRRLIKIIKPEYYKQIVDEFDALTNYSSVPYMRRFRR